MRRRSWRVRDVHAPRYARPGPDADGVTLQPRSCPPRRRIRPRVGRPERRSRALAAPLRRALAGRAHLLDLGDAVRRRSLPPRLPPRRRPELRFRSAAGPGHRRPRPRRVGPDARATRPARASRRAPPSGLIDLPFDPNLALGAFRISWHSFFALVGMLAGSWVSFRCARYLVRDDRVFPFAIAVVVGGLVMALLFVVLLAYWRRVRGRPPEGRVYFAYLLLFGGFRVITSTLRLDPVWLFGLQEAQILGIAYTVAGAAGLALLHTRSRLAA